MAKERPGKTNPSLEKKLQEALQGLLDSLKEHAHEAAGFLAPRQGKPALQPVPVRRPVYPRGRR